MFVISIFSGIAFNFEIQHNGYRNPHSNYDIINSNNHQFTEK